MPSHIHPSSLHIGAAVTLAASIFLFMPVSSSGQLSAPPTAIPLILPGGLASGTDGNLYFAETGRHLVRKISASGAMVVVAGTGVQGFAGDGGPASASLLDSPSDVAVDAAGNLFIADTHNHRVRRVDAQSGVITTIAGTGTAGSSPDGTPAASAQIDLPGPLALDAGGNLIFADMRSHRIRRIDHLSGVLTTLAGTGVQGSGGDGGLAVAAQIDSPAGLALDAAGNIFFSDTHNQRVRRVDAATRIISTLAGTGIAGFAGDGSRASFANIHLPKGLSLDSSGNLYLVDSHNQRIRRVDAATGNITTAAGDGTQGFGGDAAPAVMGTLDRPQAVAVIGGLPVFSDSANARLRGVDANANLYILAGLGASSGGTAGETLTLTGSTVVTYGTGSVNATLTSSSASGAVTLYDGLATVASVSLSANSAAFPTSSLFAGVHSLRAAYAGDASHIAAQSQVFALTVAAAPLTATPDPQNLVYGQPIPALTGTLTGLLPRDAGFVTLALNSAAAPLAAPGSYAITATISGPDAADYTLTVAPATVSVARAPATVTLTGSATTGLTVHVAPAYAGSATGTVSLLDGTNAIATATLSSSGDAAFSASGLSAGSHTLTASYAGDTDFLTASSPALLITVGAPPAADFALATNGATAVTVVGGSPAQFSFTATPLNGGLSSAIQMTVTGLPVGATASFNPAYLPPGSALTNFILTIQTIKAASLDRRSLLVYAGILAVLTFSRRRRLLRGAVALMLLGAATGCGDRVTPLDSGVGASATYNLTVLGTGTSVSGAVVQHSVTVTLTIN